MRLRGGVTLALLVALMVVPAAPAKADPAEPTNYESMVADVEPRTDGVSFRVAGGDAYLTVSAHPGHEVEVRGYFDEPYVRIEADGRVVVNVASPSHRINQSRFGQVGEDDRDSREEDWEVLAENGRYAWHDHRTHWMSEDRPPTVDPSEREQVFPWQVPVVVDGRSAVVSGELTWVPDPSPLPGLIVGLVALLPLLSAGTRRDGGPGLVLATALAATGSATYLALGTPPVGRDLLIVPVLGIVSVVFGVVAVVLRGRRVALVLATAAMVATTPVLLALLPALVRPILPVQSPLLLAAG
ncbi:MAG: hypothetical protein HKN46_07525, partial [Acidimicrobiia bacterium]|nr:hypothetical protein [Acidimicrobiia bacterium]